MNKMVKVEFRIPFNGGFRTKVQDVTQVLWDKMKDTPTNKRPGNWKYATEFTEPEVVELNLQKATKEETITTEPEVVETPKKRGPKPKNKEEVTEDETQE